MAALRVQGSNDAAGRRPWRLVAIIGVGLLALGLEVRGSSGFNLDDDAKRNELADMIVRVFLPGNIAGSG